MTPELTGSMDAWAVIARVIAADAPPHVRDSLTRLAADIEAKAAEAAHDLGMKPRDPTQPPLPLEMAAC